MRLNSILAQRKTAIIKKWFASVIETYPSDTANFLKNQQDPFANPVGRTILRSLDALFDELLGAMDHEKMSALLDPLIRIRAVQNFSPSQAAGFIFFLKNAVRELLLKEIAEDQIYDELLAFETKIDTLSLIAFNLYMQCREKISELKANEMRGRTLKVFERAGLIDKRPEADPDLKPLNPTKEASNDG